MKIGTCGFCESKRKYFQDFDVTELQNTFYDFVKEEWLKKLKIESGNNFEITFKALQIITHRIKSPTYRRFKSNFGNRENYGHFRYTNEVYSAMEKMIEYAKILGSKIIILQAPPDFSESDENLKNLNEFLGNFSGKNIRYGLELRGKWDEKTIKELIEKYDIIHIVDPFKNSSLSNDFRYYRLHGKDSYSYKYNENDLIELKKIVNSNDYVMFNNTHMCEDAKKFKEMVKNEI